MRAVEKIFYKISKIKKKKTIEIGCEDAFPLDQHDGLQYILIAINLTFINSALY